MRLTPGVVSKAFIGWILCVGACLTALVLSSSSSSSSSDATFFRFGPHDDLLIMGIRIDTPARYGGVVLYSFVNSVFRAVLHNYLQPWLINNVQDEARDKRHLDRRSAYEIASVCVVYNWTDWVLYMNILLAQADLVVVEIGADLLMALVTTAYYLRAPQQQQQQQQPLLGYSQQ
jgi:hypothetical protein